MNACTTPHALGAVRPIVWAAIAAALVGCATPTADEATAPVSDWLQRHAGIAEARPGPAPDSATTASHLQAGPLGQADAVALALATSPALQALWVESIGTQAEATRSGLPTRLHLSFERLADGNDVDITRSLGLGLIDLATWPARRGASDAAVAAERWRLAADVLTQVQAVRQQWVRAVAARQLEAYQRDVLDAAATSAELARRMQAVGNFSRLQRAREQAFQAEAAAQMVRASAAAVGEREALVRLLGLGPAHAALLQLPQQLPPLPAEQRNAAEVAARAGQERLDLLRAEQQLAGAKRRQTASGWQDVGLEAAWIGESATGGARARGAELGLNLPLDGGTGQRRAADAAVQAAGHRLQQARIDAASLLRERWAGWQLAHELALHQRDQLVPLRQTITDEMVLNYNGMLVGVFDLLADARAQVGAVIAAIEAQRDFWLADVALDAAIVGVPVAAPLPGATAAPAATVKEVH